MTAEQWNAKHPPGTPVIYAGPEGGEHIVTTTIGEASDDNGTAIVQVEARAPLWCDVDRMTPILGSSPVDAAVNAALEAAACAVEALPARPADRTSPWPVAAATVRARKVVTS